MHKIFRKIFVLYALCDLLYSGYVFLAELCGQKAVDGGVYSYNLLGIKRARVLFLCTIFRKNSNGCAKQTMSNVISYPCLTVRDV